MPFQYGGQAVLEGVMMRGPREIAVAVRRPDGEIVLEKMSIPWTQRAAVFRWPLIRGVLALVEALVLGIRALTFSANQLAEGEEEQLTPIQMTGTVVMAVALALGLFVALPLGISHLFQTQIGGLAQNLLEGLLRLLIFLGYVIVISRLPDIQRVFAYHGAEHKVIFTYEAQQPLTVENAQQHSAMHPRCGTSFLLLVMVITIFIFALIPSSNFFIRFLGRIALFPLVAGLAYEVTKAMSRHMDRWWVRWMALPGLGLQRLTTRQPDELQLEVAIQALEAVLQQDEAADSQNTDIIEGLGVEQVVG